MLHCSPALVLLCNGQRSSQDVMRSAVLKAWGTESPRSAGACRMNVCCNSANQKVDFVYSSASGGGLDGHGFNVLQVCIVRH